MTEDLMEGVRRTLARGIVTEKKVDDNTIDYSKILRKSNDNED